MLLKIGTRASKLAIAQSTWVKEQIESAYPGVDVELVLIKTKGDKILDSPLSKIGGKGLFVKEIEDALLRKDVDLAVHSIKDVPAELPDGLCLPIFPKRIDPSDAFLSTEFRSLEELPKGAFLGTGSLRRASQILNKRPDLNIAALRGNVDTRIKRLESGDVQAIILAAAGLKRLGISSKISQILPVEEFLPAIGQGALGLELRKGDDTVLDIIHVLNHKPTELAIKAERAFLKRLEGGCQVPIAGYGYVKDGKIILTGMVGELDGSRIIQDKAVGTEDMPEDMGIELAGRLLDAGAGEILAQVYGKV